MKILTAIFLICSGALATLAEAGSPATMAASASAVVISTDLINQLVVGALTNEPAPASGHDHFSDAISSEPRNS